MPRPALWPLAACLAALSQPAWAVGEPDAAQAQFDLGVAYDLGQGVRQDTAQACRWYCRAGEQGLVLGQFNIAIMYDAGRCGPRDANAAAEWYGRAAASGYARAEYNLAQMYATGDGVPRNPAQVAAWYGEAARHGVTAATDALRAVSAPASKTTGDALLRPAVPLTPRHTVPIGLSNSVAFVWEAPSQPSPTRFFFEVYSVGESERHEVFARYITRSATLVPLGAKPAHYVWRVHVVSDQTHDYAVSAPCEFDTEMPPRS